MNEEKKIAQAILDAHKMHEESYVVESKGIRDIEGDTFGEYKSPWGFCFQLTCDKLKLSPNLWELLCLANNCYNELADWAEEILKG